MQALENALEFNQGFRKPLVNNEVEKITVQAEKAYEKWLLDSPNGVYKRGGYNYKNETLIENLNITADEMKVMTTIINPGEKLRMGIINNYTNSGTINTYNLNTINPIVNNDTDKKEIIKELTDKLNLLDSINSTINEIKNKIN